MVDALYFILKIAKFLLFGFFGILLLISSIIAFLKLKSKISQLFFLLIVRKNRPDVLIFYCENEVYNQIVKNELIKDIKLKTTEIEYKPVNKEHLSVKLARMGYEGEFPFIAILGKYTKYKATRLRLPIIKYLHGNHQKINNIKNKLNDSYLKTSSLANDNILDDNRFDIVTEAEFRKILSQGLVQDAQFHRLQKWKDIGLSFEELEGQFTKFSNKQFMLVYNFWDAWIDEMNHDFKLDQYGIDPDEWPIIAEEIAENILKVEEITNEKVLALIKA